MRSVEMFTHPTGVNSVPFGPTNRTLTDLGIKDNAKRAGWELRFALDSAEPARTTLLSAWAERWGEEAMRRLAP